MAYGEKYHVIYCDRNGKQFKLAIHEWDYSGASVRHKAAPSPFMVSQETTAELKMGGIYPTRATVTLVSSKTFNMEELYTADERKYLVTHEPTDGGDQGKWYGNIIPNGFTEEMDNDVHYMVLTASDNLPTLKLKLFTQEDGTNYGLPDGDFQQSFMWVAKEALKKTGFLLPIWTMVDVKPMLTNVGTVRALSVGFVSPSTMRIIDSSNTVDGILEVGMSISVTGGVNDGSGFTVVSWTTTQQWDGSDFISVTISETAIDSGGFENVTLSFYDDVPASSLPDPLAITVHDVRTYIRDQDIEGKNYYEVNGSAMSTWDVLNNLAKQWNAKIYQNNGRWEIVRWNALAVDGVEYKYFVYNADGVQTGREDFGHDVLYPCKSTKFNFRPFGHSIGMDRVLGAVGVNYKYKFKTDGDSLVNLIKGGNFIPPLLPIGGSVDPSTYTPLQWQRRRAMTTPAWATLASMYIRPSNSSPLPPYVGPPGILSFIRMNGIYHDRQWLTTYSGYPTNVSSGDGLRISWWQRVNGQMNVGGAWIYARSVIRIIISSPEGIPLYFLVNGGTKKEQDTESCQWVAYNNDTTYPAFTTQAPGTINAGQPFPPAPGVDGLSDWGEVKLTTPPCPSSGVLIFEIVGSGMGTVLSGEPNRQPNTVPIYAPTGSGVTSVRNWNLASTEIWFTGFFAAKVVDTSSEEVPLIHPYWYPEEEAQRDRHYTDQIDDIEVLLGDDDSPDHVSNIYVMDGSSRKAVKSWDSWSNDFGWGALGLILAKSIIQQYWVPWRIIDGDFVAPNIHWASRIEFEERPGERYALLRGTLDPINNRFSGTIVQVADDGTPELPPGGNDGGTTVDPNWQPTGTIRCVRDENGENTGDQEQLEVDMNPSSQTSGQQRWTNIGENTDACPIGEPIDFYWGASTLPIDPATLEYFPYVKDSDNYTMQFTNDGTGKYLAFLWRKSLGTVQSILDVELEETISSWVVESDVVINGYTYGVMRMAYMTGVFTGLDKTFKIQ